MLCIICQSPSGANKLCKNPKCMGIHRSHLASATNKRNPDNNPHVVRSKEKYYAAELDEILQEHERQDILRELPIR